MYRPELTLSNGKAGAEEELGDLGNQPLRVFSVVPQDVLRNRWIADDDKVARPSREAINWAILLHPLEQREEEGTPKEIRDIVELGVRHRNAGFVLPRKGTGQGGEPVRADPGAAAAWLLLGGRRRRRRNSASQAERDSSGPPTGEPRRWDPRERIAERRPGGEAGSHALSFLESGKKSVHLSGQPAAKKMR